MLAITDRMLNSLLWAFCALVVAILLITGSRNIYLLTLPVLIIAAAVVFQRIVKESEGWEKIPREATDSESKALVSAFFILFSLGIVLFNFRNEIYVRPPEYFLFLISMIVVIILQIFYVRTRPALVVAQLVALSLSVIMTQYLLFPGPIGKDVWYFAYESRLLVQGAEWYGGNYRYTPLFVYWEGMTVILSGLEYNVSRLIGTVTMQVLSLLLLSFVISKRVFNSARAALIACFLMAMSPAFISYGLKATPFSFATALIFLTVFLLMVIESKRMGTFVLIIVIYFVVMLTHNLAVILLTAIIFTFIPINRLFNRSGNRSRSSMTLYVILGVLILTIWTYVGNQTARLARFLSIGFHETWDQSNLPNLSTEMLVPAPVFEELLHSLYPFALVFLSLVGLILMVNNRSAPKKRMFSIIVMIPLAILLFQFLFPVSFVEERWVFYSYLFMAFPAGYALIRIASSPRLYSRKAVVAGILLLLSAVSVLGPASYDDSHLTPNIQIRPSLELSEIQAMVAFSDIGFDILTGDSYYVQGHLTKYYGILHSERALMDKNLISGNFTDLKGRTILIRHHIMEGPFELTRTYKTISYDPTYNLQQQGFDKVYSNGRVSAFR